MNKVIKGKLYDTETATKIAIFNGPQGPTTLYQKKNGEYFLNTGFNKDGQRIIPMSENDAKSWVAEGFDGKQYMEIFGPVAE